MTDALDNLLKAAKAVARHEQAHRQCVPSEHREILMRVGELFELSDAVAAVEAALRDPQAPASGGVKLREVLVDIVAAVKADTAARTIETQRNANWELGRTLERAETTLSIPPRQE